MEVGNHIHDDIAFSILSKLSLKSLKRFECVNKSWSLLFDNPYFMTLYRNYLLTKNHPYYEDTIVLLQTRPIDRDSYYNDINILHCLSGERCENMVQLDWPKPFSDDDNPFQEDDPHPPPFEDYASSSEEDDDAPNQEVSFPLFKMLGSVSINGTLCLESFEPREIKIVLWNPTTKEFKLIPPSPIECKPCWYVYSNNGQVRVGYDRVTHDYKLIRFISFQQSRDCPMVSFWEIYSLNSNTWRTIDVDMLCSSHDKVNVYMDGMCHWWTEKEAQTYLVSFDFSNESSFTTLIPFHVDKLSWCWRRLVLLNGSIAFILYFEITSVLHISILGELGVKDSWIKLFVVESLPCLHFPIGAGKKGRILFRKKDGEVAWFDLSNKRIEEIGVATSFTLCQTVFHKESILPIGGINS